MKRIDIVAYGLLLALAVVACGYAAKTQYGAQLDACVDQAKTRPEADACLAQIRAEWDEAGAKPAAVDGGVE